MGPTLAGFMAFVANVMAIPTAALPTSSPIIPIAYQIALEIVNQALACVPASSPSTPSLYALAVYNLAGDRLINYAPDQAGQTYFADLRKTLNISGFVGGVISSTADQGTSESLVVPDAMKGLTFADLQTLKTPYGRTYLGIAQSYGPSVWGLS